MASRPVQISLDRQLLERIDRDPVTKREGRSAFVRAAIELYLEAKRRKEIDRRIATAFRGHEDELQAEVEAMSEAQQWPEK